MKFLGFLVLSAIYGALACFVCLQIIFSCGLGPESQVSCNESADRNAAIFAISAIIFYAVLAFLFWRRSRSEVK